MLKFVQSSVAPVRKEPELNKRERERGRAKFGKKLAVKKPSAFVAPVPRLLQSFDYSVLFKALLAHAITAEVS